MTSENLDLKNTFLQQDSCKNDHRVKVQAMNRAISKDIIVFKAFVSGDEVLMLQQTGGEH